MDAAQTNIKRIAFFLAIALCLTALVQGARAATLNTSNTSVTIGSSACNNYQSVQLTSSDGSTIQFTVQIQYSGGSNNGDQYGQWLYATVSGSGSTAGPAFTAATAGRAGTTLTVGLNRSIGAVSPTANVVVTPINPSGSPITIEVFYTQNTSCGGNTGSASNSTLSVTPGNVSLTAALGGQQAQTLVVQNLTGSSLTFTISTQGGAWLTATANSTVLSPNGSAAVTVTGDASKVSATGTYSGSVAIQAYLGNSPLDTTLNLGVTFGVTTGSGGGGGGGGGGTLTVNGASSNTYSTSFSLIAPTSPSGQCVPIQDTASGANTYSYQVNTDSGGSWLEANYQTSGTIVGLLSPGSNACVNLLLSNQATALASGVYQGSVSLTSSSGSVATINVTLYVSGGAGPGITVTPSLIYIFPNVAVNGNVVQSENFAISAAPGYTLGTAALSSTADGFSITTPVASGSTESFAVTANSNGLPAGVYTTTVTMQSTTTSSGAVNTTYITLVLPVGQPGATTGGGGTAVAPLVLNFQEQLGNTFWTCGQQAQTLTIIGPQGSPWNAAIVFGSGSNWLSFDSASSGTFGSGPASLSVDLFNGVAGLAASGTPYTATVSITTNAGTSSVAVNLLVTPANSPILLGKPALTTLSSTNGATASQTVAIVGSDNPGSTSSPLITLGTPTASWLTATASGNSMTVNANPAGQNTGVYYGTILVSATAYANAISYPVVLIVNGGGGGTSSGPLTLTTTALSFNNVTGQISQSLGVTASSSTNFTALTSETTCTGATWLQIPTNNYTAGASSTSVTVTVNPAGVANGTTCSGVLSLVTSSVTQTVSVTMTVGSSIGSGNVTVSPLSMSFSYTQGQSVPVAQTATVVNATSGTPSIPFTVTIAESSGTSIAWLQDNNVTSASTPYNNPGLSVSVAPGSLNPGTYQGTVTSTPTGGATQVINVSLTVTGSATVSASPTTLNMSYIVGGASPTATIQVSGGGASAAFTAVASSSAGWLAVSPTSGTTPNSGTFNLTASLVSTVLSTLNPNTYSGTITVTGASPATGTTIINVTLAITAPLPVIIGVTNAASGATGPVSPGELISIYAPTSGANPIGPAIPVKLDSTTCPGTCTQVPMTMGQVQVVFLPIGYTAPLIFVSSGQINAVVPYEIASVANLSVEVKYLGQASNAFPLQSATTAPGIFSYNGTGTGQAAIAEYDATGKYIGINSASLPAQPGWILSVYMTGEGVLVPGATDGAVTMVLPAPPYLPQPLSVPIVRIGNQPCSLAGYGDASGLVSGVLQVNVIVPPGAGSGPVSLSVSLGGNSAQAGMTVALQ